MDMQLYEQALGSEGSLDLELQAGKVVLVVKHGSKALTAELKAAVDPDYFMDKLAALIPGEVDNAIFEIIKGALKA